MTRRRMRIEGLVVIAAILATLGGGAFNGVTAASTGRSPLSHDQWDSIVSIANGDSDTFAGVGVDAASGVATVYVTERARGSQKAIKALQRIEGVAASPRAGASVAWLLQIASGRHSMRELNVAMDKATNDSSWRSLANRYLAQWYVDAALNAVQIGLTQITPQVERAATRMFGDLARLTISERPVLTDRHDQIDSVPWWGGDGIKNWDSSASCTGGFPVSRNSDSAQGMLTAGHCFVTGAQIYQPDLAHSCMGKVTTRRNGGTSYYDFEWIDLLSFCSGSYVRGTAQGHVYRKGPYVRPITGLAHAYVGDQACVDGAYTEENCSGFVNNSNLCFTDSTHGITYCHMARVNSSNSTVLARLGDSGGPVYLLSGTKTYAQGLISATASSGHTAYITPMWRILQDNGYTLITCLSVC
jgi:hypothetical protein